MIDFIKEFKFRIIGGCLFIGGFFAIDMIGIDVLESDANVLDIYYRGSYTNTSTILIGKTLVPRVDYHSASCEVLIEFEGRNVMCNLDESFCEELSSGDNLYVSYSFGRITNMVYIKEVEL